ncbi:hypothetical protein P8C59_005488 [Phyllachora maydis]|uniref:Phosphatidate cytidylyltransferase n=1 Tax=Phyllachora maydis TaxID=1825666 RepID=A0AAD9I4H0_9PEZI|nr:hypothetical protein P8C59_005488 [Phyllachora maydis]
MFWPLRFYNLRPIFVGVIVLPPLPPFPYNMSIRGKTATPGTPRVISPSPTPPSDQYDAAQALYSGPVTRSAVRTRQSTSRTVHENGDDALEHSELRRSRTRSRSPMGATRVGKLTTADPPDPASTTANAHAGKPPKNVELPLVPENGHLSPPGAPEYMGWSWRDFSRSPSPLGLIPIHRHWRTFVHKYEVPRKTFHVSIGFFVTWLYLSGVQTETVCPYLLGAFVPLAVCDVLRHRYAPFNRFYVRVFGALMRESEFMGYNSSIFFLLGTCIVLFCFPKDIAVLSTLLLSWCDTAASTFGRLYGRYTPRTRRGKSLAGSLSACLVGVGTAAWFWGWLAPSRGPMAGDGTFMFQGALHLPQALADAIGLTREQASISGGLALGVMSVWSGIAAATSEALDVLDWDDNLTIPVLSGLGIWAFLKVFG